jgi:hypothetical protein
LSFSVVVVGRVVVVDEDVVLDEVVDEDVVLDDVDDEVVEGDVMDDDVLDELDDEEELELDELELELDDELLELEEELELELELEEELDELLELDGELLELEELLELDEVVSSSSAGEALEPLDVRCSAGCSAGVVEPGVVCSGCVVGVVGCVVGVGWSPGSVSGVPVVGGAVVGALVVAGASVLEGPDALCDVESDDAGVENPANASLPLGEPEDDPLVAGGAGGALVPLSPDEAGWSLAAAFSKRCSSAGGSGGAGALPASVAFRFLFCSIHGSSALMSSGLPMLPSGSTDT